MCPSRTSFLHLKVNKLEKVTIKLEKIIEIENGRIVNAGAQNWRMGVIEPCIQKQRFVAKCCEIVPLLVCFW